MSIAEMQWDRYFTPPKLFGREAELSILKHMMLDQEAGIVNIHGSIGFGKTSLARAFAHDNRESFPGGAYYVSAEDGGSLEEKISRRVSNPSSRYLIIVDGLLEGNFLPEVMSIRRLRPSASLLLISLSRIGEEIGIPSLAISGLKSDGFTSLVLSMLGNGYDPLLAAKLFQDLSGSPLALRFFADVIVERSSTIESLSEDVRLYRFPTLLDANGKPYRTDSSEEIEIISEVRAFTDEVLRSLRDHPNDIYELSPRRFEELMAELLNRQGFDVTLTPASKDGGKDIYVAQKSALGTFTFIVECKKYAPTNKVGVRLIRELGGVVSSERFTAGILATTSFFTKGAVEYQKLVPNQIGLHDYYGIRKMLEDSVK